MPFYFLTWVYILSTFVNSHFFLFWLWKIEDETSRSMKRSIGYKPTVHSSSRRWQLVNTSLALSWIFLYIGRNTRILAVFGYSVPFRSSISSSGKNGGRKKRRAKNIFGCAAAVIERSSNHLQLSPSITTFQIGETEYKAGRNISPRTDTPTHGTSGWITEWLANWQSIWSLLFTHFQRRLYYRDSWQSIFCISSILRWAKTLRRWT